jgi:hypothetical protein
MRARDIVAALTTIALGAAILEGCATYRGLPLKPLAIYSAGAAADLVSTERALAGGAAEANPAMQGGTGQRAAIKAAQVAVVTAVDQVGCDRLAHPGRCRWLLRCSWLALHGWIAARNTRAVQ